MSEYKQPGAASAPSMTDTLDDVVEVAIEEGVTLLEDRDAVMQPRPIERIRIFDWLERGNALYGKDQRDWRFVCCSCGHVQSVFAVKGRCPDLTLESIENWITHECEGRHNKNESARYRRGCLWTLGGLLQFHEVEVIVSEEDIQDPRCGYKQPTMIRAFRFDEPR